jgi:hypothetical protein
VGKVALCSAASVALGFAGLAIAQGSKQQEAICAQRTAVYPVPFQTSSELTIEQQPRFEIRMCGSGQSEVIQLLGYSARQTRPALVINTGAKHADLLIQTGNALVLQAQDGVSSSALYLVQFQNGKPVLVAKDRTVGGVSYSEDHQDIGDYVTITVPLKTYRDETAKPSDVPPHQYRLRVDTE